MDGVLVIDKPCGPTSHDVVAKIRRGLGIEKVGHTGTLDPMATGVLPLVLGRGTKLAQYLTGGDKSYRATLQLGVTTQTLDAQGEVVLTRPTTGITPEAIEAALVPLRGTIHQVPPMYSAKKIEGKKLYELARKGVEVVREAKVVTVHALTLVSVAGDEVVFDVTCSAGTYVRVLAQDIGELLGCGAHLTALRRTAAGPFGLDQAIELKSALDDPQMARSHVLPLSHALMGLGRISVGRDIGRQIVRGHQLSVADLRGLDTPAFGLDEPLALALDDGDLIAVARAEVASDELPCARRDRRALRTERVLVQAL